jgi:hypothetical protein
MHKCKETCSDCMSVPPCTFSGVRIPCNLCNKNFRSHACFDRHKTMKLGGKTLCERNRICAICGEGMPPGMKHECLNKFCSNCKVHREFGHLLYESTKDFIASWRQCVICVLRFWNDAGYEVFRIGNRAHRLQTFRTLCENVEDINADFLRCGKRIHSFFDDPISDLLSYLCEPRQWCEKIVTVAHNTKSFDTQIILNRAILLKWITE